MANPVRRRTVTAVFASFPSAWLLVAMPFFSSIMIASMPPLQRTVRAHSRVTWPVGAIGLGVLLAALTGVIPPSIATPVAIIAGVASGFAMFWVPRTESDGDDWRKGPPPPNDPPPDPEEPGPFEPGPFDWQEFDRLRALWERTCMPAGQ